MRSIDSGGTVTEVARLTPTDVQLAPLLAETNAASNLRWSCKHVYDAEYLAADKAAETLHEHCSNLVESRAISPSDLRFQPYLFGGPAGQRAGFTELNAGHMRSVQVCATFKGIVYTHNRDIDLLMASSGDSPPAGSQLSGRAASCRGWAQKFADVMGLPAEIAQGAKREVRDAKYVRVKRVSEAQAEIWNAT